MRAPVGPVGDELPGRLDPLLSCIQACPVPFSELRLEDKPACSCGLALTDQPPTADVDGFLRDLERALQTQQRRLASEAIHRVLARSHEGRVSAFVQAVQTANTASLIDVMDEELATYIRVLLEEEEVAPAETDVLRRFVEAYPTLEEADLTAAVQEFERLLRESFEQARRRHPDKKSVRLTLR